MNLILQVGPIIIALVGAALAVYLICCVARIAKAQERIATALESIAAKKS
jgi:uncharacterized protein YoxC